jgi:hypothetical protein
MRPKKHETTGSNDLFRARLEQIINMKHELVALAGKIDWDWLDREVAPLYGDKGRPGIETRFDLKGRGGDAANAVLTAVGYNFRLILAWLRALLRLILVALLYPLRVPVSL